MIFGWINHDKPQWPWMAMVSLPIFSHGMLRSCLPFALAESVYFLVEVTELRKVTLGEAWGKKSNCWLLNMI